MEERPLCDITILDKTITFGTLLDAVCTVLSAMAANDVTIDIVGTIVCSMTVSIAFGACRTFRAVVIIEEASIALVL